MSNVNDALSMSEYQIKIDFPMWMAGRLWYTGIYKNPQPILVRCAMQYIGDETSAIYFVKDGVRVDPEVQEKVLYKKAFAYVKMSKGSMQFKNIFGEIVANIKIASDTKSSSGFDILGAYTSYEELVRYRPIANEKEAYLVKGDIYMWSSDYNGGMGEWINGGPLTINVSDNVITNRSVSKNDKKDEKSVSTQLYLNMIEIIKQTGINTSSMKNVWVDTLKDDTFLNKRISKGYVYDKSKKYCYRPDNSLKLISGNTLSHFAFNTLSGVADNKNAKLGNSIVISNEQFRFGSGSCYFTGDTESYIYEDNERLNFGKNDFTIHTWVYPEYQKSVCPVIFSNADNTVGLIIKDILSNDSISFFIGEAVPRSIDSNTLYEANMWTHLAITRSEGIFYLFINGELKGKDNDNINTDIDIRNLNIGLTSSSIENSAFVGYIDDFVIVDKALWLDNFDVPSNPWILEDQSAIAEIYWKSFAIENDMKSIMLTSEYVGDVRFYISTDNKKTFSEIVLDEFTQMERIENSVIVKAILTGDESNIYSLGVVFEK